MKRGKPVILLLTILLAAIAVVFGRNEIGMRNFPFSVMITSDGAREELRCVKLGGEYYMFLPSYAQEAVEQIDINPIYDVYIEGEQLRKNQSCTAFPTNTKLELHYRSMENEGYETITFVRSANVATMYINVPSGNMEYIHEEKGNAEAGWIRVYTETGELNYSGSLESVKGRGNATWEDDKKSYSLELTQEADLLNLGKGGRWILLANSYDTSHLRNKLAFDMAQSADMLYSPGCTWTDLYLNGEYAGLYLLSERNEVHPQRVAIDPSSSFLVAVEPEWRLQQQGYAYVRTESGTALRIHHSTLSQDTMRQIWQSAENAIFAADGYDAATGKRWDQLIDMDSWARKYLMEEILVNTDACLASEFFYYDGSDGVIYAGPIWDMDVTLRSAADAPWMEERAIIAGRPHLIDVDDRNYFYELLQKPEFRDRVEVLYQTEFRPLLSRLLDSELDAYARKTEQAAQANQVRWNVRDPGTKVSELTQALQNRVEFLDVYWIQKEQPFLVQVLQHDRVWAFGVYPGETLEFLPDMESGAWYRVNTGAPLDKTLPVDSDLMLAVQ